MTAEEILHAAATRPPAERAAYLESTCGGDAALRARVQGLLNAHEQAGSFLERPLFDTVAATPPVLERAGTSVGPYKLLQQVGEGGMGVVFLAEQQRPVRRQVAVKVVKAGMDTRQVIARFEAERQALAMMDHPNIAKVLDAGATESGRPYFVMELVKGVPVTKYCDEHRLTPKDRLELFIQVCQAVQHAHQKGIIHRDLKPNNVLVALYDGKPVPKVIDFGVAKATGARLTERTLFTGFGAVVGTPEYMSPEQAELNQLDVDTRSDVYSLGVLLYELLTGSTPFDRTRFEKAQVLEILRVVREEEPQRPSTRLSTTDQLPSIAAQRGLEPKKLSGVVRGELDWIVMKALEKDRSRRYETANGLAMDLQRYLTGEPVQACPASAGYRFRKFARRNRAAVLTAAAILLVLVAGIAGTTFGLIQAERRRAEAVRARGDEAAQRLIADAQKRKAEQAEADTLSDYRASTDDAIEQLIGSKPTLGPQERTYLEKTLKRWQAFAARQGDDERSQATRAEGHKRVAYLWYKLGRLDEARTEYEAARDLFMNLVATFPAVPAYQRDLAIVRTNLGSRLREVGQRDQALIEYETARGLQRKLVEAFPAVPLYKMDLALTRNNLGILLNELGRRDEALAEHEAARGLQQGLVEAFPASPQYQHELARTHHNLGILLKEMGRHDVALTEYERARDLKQKLAATLPAVPDYQIALAGTRNSLASLLKALGRRDEARAEYEAARDLCTTLAADFPAVPDYQLELAFSHHGLGGLLRDLGQSEAARAEYESARDLRMKLVAAFPAVVLYQEELAHTHTNLGLLLAAGGHREAARREYESARDLRKRLTAAFATAPKYALELSATHHLLGGLLNELGHGDAARTEYEAVRGLQQKLVAAFPAVPEYRLGLAQTQNFLAELLEGLGQRDAARAEHEKARDLYRTLVADFPAMPQYQQELAATHDRLGFLLRELGRRDAARTEYETARGLQQKLVEAFPDVPAYQIELGGSYCNYGNLLTSEGRFADSLQWYDLAIRTLTPVYDGDRRAVTARQYLRNSHLARARACGRLMKHAQADNDWDRVLELDPKNAGVFEERGVAFVEQRKWDEAVATFRKVVELDPKTPGAYVNLGSAQLNQGKLDDAIDTYRKALAINVDYALAHECLGFVFLAKGKPDEAIAAYRRAVELSPGFARAWYGLANAFAKSGQWDESAAAYVKAMDLAEPLSLRTWLDAACTLVQAGDTGAYRKLCEGMARRFGQGRDPHQIAFLAHVCVLAPNALADDERVLQLAVQRIALTREIAVHKLWSTHILALGFYRAGQFEKAVASLEDAQKEPDLTSEVRISNWLALAMSRQRLGQHPEAAAALQSARAILANEKRVLDRQNLIVQILLREAETLLGKQ